MRASQVRTIAPILALIFLIDGANAQGKTCVYNCTPPPAPSGGGGGGGGIYYHPAPAPYVPSPAEIAAQQRRAAARRANLQGNAALAKNDYQTAIRLYQQAHNNAPTDLVILRNLNYATGAAAHARKDYSAALTFYNVALSYAPGDQNILRDIRIAGAHQANDSGNVASEKSDHNAAVEAYKTALQLSPNDNVIKRNFEDALAAQKQAREMAIHKADQDKRDSIIKPGIAPLLDKLSAQFKDGGDFDGKTRPPVSGGGSGSDGKPLDAPSAGLDFAAGNLSAIDASVVDLRDKGKVVGPSIAKNVPVASPMPPSALQRAPEEDLRFLFPQQFPQAKSLWPGPRNPGQPLMNPLREPVQYSNLLVKELSSGRTPEQKKVIEKLIAGMDKVKAEVWDEQRKEIKKSLDRAQTSALRTLGEVMSTTGVGTVEELDARRRLDPALDRLLREKFDPIWAAEQAKRDFIAQVMLQHFMEEYKRQLEREAAMNLVAQHMLEQFGRELEEREVRDRIAQEIARIIAE